MNDREVVPSDGGKPLRTLFLEEIQIAIGIRRVVEQGYSRQVRRTDIDFDWKVKIMKIILATYEVQGPRV